MVNCFTKLPCTKTNEQRDNVINPMCAKFLANQLLCARIISLDTDEDVQEVVNNYNGIELKYLMDNMIESDNFDKDLSKVCTRYIHYFNSIAPAFYYGEMPHGWTGKWTEYWSDGHQFTEYYVNGKSEQVVRLLNTMRDKKLNMKKL